MVILDVSNMTFSYAKVTVLKDITFSVNGGSLLGVVGPNGSGKTTLLKCINNLLSPDQGQVYVKDDLLVELSNREVAKRLGYVPQVEDPVFPSTVFDLVLTGRTPHSSWRPSNEDLSVASSVLESLGMEEFALRDVNSLSGGELRKVLIARAFVQEPELLLLDEPMASLDLRHQLEVLGVLKSWLNGSRAAVVTFHDLNLAAKYCDELLVLKEGEIFARGGPEILTPNVIEPVYGVEVEVNYDSVYPTVNPIKPLTN